MAWPPGPRPTVWMHPDPDIHKKYTPYQRMKAQAHYRGEEFSLTFEQYCEFWTEDRWQCRGRGISDLCMSMRDLEKGWHYDNIEIILRRDQLKKTRRPDGFWNEKHATSGNANRQPQKNTA